MEILSLICSIALCIAGIIIFCMASSDKLDSSVSIPLLFVSVVFFVLGFANFGVMNQFIAEKNIKERFDLVEKFVEFDNKKVD